MSLLERHLEQIALSAESIATLPFPPPKIFTNALLATPDITSLIRDTEPHERALFSVPPPQTHSTASTPYPDPAPSSRRQTVFNVAQGEVTAGTAIGSRAPRRNTAVAAVLGAELHSEVRKTEGKGEIDIEVLLRGAEKLNNVYSVAGVPERIQGLRKRYVQILGGLEFYEEKVRRQMRDLERINRGGTPGDEDDEEFEDEDMEGEEGFGGREEEIEVTEEDLRAEEEEIRELERKKEELEARVKGMEKDLGGLLR
ncbi:DASH complex, subunit Spc34 [Cadophora sp. DSE1049]|nr:DASH complex, subunit Spc34 [Cadophora sp. DSE1049]